MRRLALLSLLAGGAWAGAPSNTVAILDLSGVAQANRPVTVSRFFAEGEIPLCALARINGTAVTTQTDVRTRWPDGSLQHAMVSFAVPMLAANSAVTVQLEGAPNCNNAGELTQSAILSATASWAATLGAEIRTTNGAVTQAANLRTMLTNWDGTDSGVHGLGIRYWLKGPVATQLIVEDRTPSRAYDIGWSYNGTTWVTSTTNRSLHPVFVVTLWPGQPYVKIECIVENPWTTALQDQKYDLSIRLGNPLAGADPATTWLGESSYLPRPGLNHYARTRWHKVFWSGTAPGEIKLDLSLSYMIYSRSLPPYDLVKTVGANSVNTEVTNWDNLTVGEKDIGGEGSLVKFMPQTGQTVAPYIGLIPQWSVKHAFTMANPLVDNGILRVIFGNGDVGAHVPIHYRESRNDSTKKFCNLSCDSTWNALDAAGRIVSIDARPTFRSRDLSGVGGDAVTPVATLSTSTAPCAGCTVAHGWTVDLAHQPGHAFYPYLISGEWYYLEEMQFWSAHNVSWPNSSNTLVIGRHSDWGYISDEIRGEAWALRTLTQSALLSPTGSPEKQYWDKKLEHQIAIREGAWNIRNGYFFNDPLGRWTFGRGVQFGGQLNPLFLPKIDCSGSQVVFRFIAGATNTTPISITVNAHGAANNDHAYITTAAGNTAANGKWAITNVTPNTFDLIGSAGNGAYTGSGEVQLPNLEVDPWWGQCTTHAWQWNFLLASLGYSEQVGNYKLQPVLRAYSSVLLNGTLNPDIDPRLYTSGYFTLHMRAETGGYIKSWRQLNDAILASHRIAELDQFSSRRTDPTGYLAISRAASGFTAPYQDGPFSGPAARAWHESNTIANFNNNPKWSLVPRFDPGSAQITPGDTGAVIEYRAPRASEACTLKIDDAPDFSSPLLATADAPGTRWRRHVASGLIAGTTYYFRLSCASDPYQSGNTDLTWATLSAGGAAATFNIALTPPATILGTAVAKAAADYGSTAALGSATAAVSCSPGCTLAVPATARRPLHYRVKYLSAADAVLASGQIQASIAP